MALRQLIKQLELFLTYLKKLTPQDFYELEHGISKIGFVMKSVGEACTFTEKEAYTHYVQELHLMTTREQCMEYFDKLNLQKKDLEGILKCFGVPFNKKDNKSKLQSKIIESTVGKKLRDEAIINK